MMQHRCYSCGEVGSGVCICFPISLCVCVCVCVEGGSVGGCVLVGFRVFFCLGLGV